MLRFRVIAPKGARVSGPAVLALTPDQAGRRAHALQPTKGRAPKGLGLYALGGSVEFKHGEEIGFSEDPGKLSRAQFEPADKATAAALNAAAGDDDDGGGGDDDGGDGGGGEGSGDGTASDDAGGEGSGDAAGSGDPGGEGGAK